MVQEVSAGGVAQEAGVKAGDRLLALGDVEIMDPDFGTAFRARFGKSEGDSLPIRVRRGADTLTLHGIVRLVGEGGDAAGGRSRGEREGGAGAERNLDRERSAK